jgi:hypothetical protein
LNCQLCDQRTIYYGRNSPCPDCKLKSAAKEEEKVPYWVKMAKFGGLI